MSVPPPRHLAKLSIWPPVVFLLGFAVLLVLVSRFYLLPTFEAVKQKAPADQKDYQTWIMMIRSVKAWSALSLAILLVLLMSGLILTFRIGRFFFPRPSSPRVRTKHVDAWAESAKRMKMPPDDNPERLP